MATIRDVATLAKVSVATVSRVLNKNGYVKPETEMAVMKAIEQLQYNPNPAARMLNGKKMGAIALILPDISNPFFPELARGVEDTAVKHGLTVFLCNSDDLGMKEKNYIKLLKRRSVDGMIFASSTLDREDVEEIGKENIPIVVMDRASIEDNRIVVKAKNAQGVKMALQHLAATGCRKIAHICGPRDLITARERLAAYEEFAWELRAYDPDLIEPGHFTMEGGKEAAERILERHPDIDGIFAGNDLMAIGALKALIKKGKKVPDDISLIGFDGIAIGGYLEPELSTVTQPIYEMGQTAVNLLLRRIRDWESGGAEVVEFDVKLTLRGTTKPVA